MTEGKGAEKANASISAAGFGDEITEPVVFDSLDDDDDDLPF